MRPSNMLSKQQSKYTALDVSGNGNLVVAISNVNSSENKIRAGELLRTVSMNNPENLIYESKAMQQLVQESHVIFSQVQRASKEGFISVADILEYSLQYRSVIRSTLVSLDRTRNDIREFLESAELIWSLAEAIFLKTHDSSIVVDLMTWARVSFQSGIFADELSASLRTSKIKDLDKEKFWLQITYFVLSGSFSSAVKFLEAYANFTKDEAVRKLTNVLADLNVDLLNDENTTQDFINYQKDVQRLCASGAFRSNANAERIALLIAGDEVMMKTSALSLRRWYELVPPYLLFLKPYTTFSQLNDIVKECLKIFGHTGSDGVHAVMSSLFSLEAVRALVNIARWSNNWWLAPHLADLLQKADERITFAYDIDFRQRLLLEYGTSLFNEPGLWKIGFDYLCECGDEGLEKLRLLAETVPLDNERTAYKLSTYCIENGFNDLCACIARTISFELLRRERWGSALSWSLRTGDVNFISMVAEQVLERCPSEVISSVGLIMEQTEIILLSPSLMRLHEYLKYWQLRNRGEKIQAGKGLIDLLVFDGNSRLFRNKLLADFIDLLNNSDKVVISKDDSYKILQRLITFEHGRTQEDDSEDFLSHLRNLQYLVIRNLSNATASDG